MSRVFTDGDLLTWEAYSSGGRWGLPEQPKIVFHCVSDPNRRARYVTHDGDSAGAEETVQGASPSELARLLEGATELS
jgi:hypothetical protein